MKENGLEFTFTLTFAFELEVPFLSAIELDEIELEKREYIPDEDDHEVEDDDGIVKFGNAGIDRGSVAFALFEAKVVELLFIENGPEMSGEVGMSVLIFGLERLKTSFSKEYFSVSNSLPADDDILESEFISRRCSNMVLLRQELFMTAPEKSKLS